MSSAPIPKLLIAGLILLFLFAAGSVCWIFKEGVRSDGGRVAAKAATSPRDRITNPTSGESARVNRHPTSRRAAAENRPHRRPSGLLVGTKGEDDDEGVDGRGTDDDLKTEPSPAERMDVRLGEEPVDMSWAPAFEQMVTKAMGQEVFSATKLLGVSCRTSLCKMSLAHDDVESQDLFIDTFLLYGPSDVSGGAWKQEEDENGNLRTSFYLQRKSEPE